MLSKSSQTDPTTFMAAPAHLTDLDRGREKYVGGRGHGTRRIRLALCAENIEKELSPNPLQTSQPKEAANSAEEAKGGKNASSLQNI